MPLLEEKIALIEKDISSVAQQIAALKVTDEETKAKAVDWLGQIKSRAKRIEYLRHEFVDPLNTQVRKINNMFKVQLEPLEKMEAFLKNGIVRYMEEEERKARIEAERLRKEAAEKARLEEERLAKLRAEEERLRKEAEAAKNAEEKARLQWEADNKQDEAVRSENALVEAETPIVEAPKTTVRSESGTFSLKKVWKWDVEDETILRKAHPELFVLDAKAVNKLIQDGEREIAGLKIYQASEGAMRA